MILAERSQQAYSRVNAAPLRRALPSLRSNIWAQRYAPHRRTCVPGAERVVATRASAEDASNVAAPPLEDPVTPPTAADHTPEEPETVFYEGPGSNAELVISLLLMPTLFYAPLSIASIGRRLWISFKFTNKRLAVINTSPLFKRTIEVSYKNIKEVRTGPRAFGLWGDMVVFLRDGSRLELTGIEKYKEIADYINRCIYTL